MGRGVSSLIHSTGFHWASLLFLQGGLLPSPPWPSLPLSQATSSRSRPYLTPMPALTCSQARPCLSLSPEWDCSCILTVQGSPIVRRALLRQDGEDVTDPQLRKLPLGTWIQTAREKRTSENFGDTKSIISNMLTRGFVTERGNSG